MEDFELESRRHIFHLENTNIEERVKSLLKDTKSNIKKGENNIAYEKVCQAEILFLSCLEEAKFLLTEQKARLDFRGKGNYGKYPW